MRLTALCTLFACLALCACGKPASQNAASTDDCADAKGAPPYQTDAEAVKACRDNKKFSGSDVKRSKIQITNH